MKLQIGMILSDNMDEFSSVEIISEWRKGFAVACLYSKIAKPHRQYLLLDQNYTIHYTMSDYNEDQLELPLIERVFGGNYIVKTSHQIGRLCIPGRDDEENYETVVYCILDSDGKEIKDNCIHSNNIGYKHLCYKELGNAIIFYKNSLYNLEDYSLIKELPYNIDEIRDCKNGERKFYVIDDFRDYYVIVKDCKIIKYYQRKNFEEIASLFNISLKAENRRTDIKQIKPDKDSIFVVREPFLICKIEKYLYEMPSNFSTINNICHLNNDTKYGDIMVKASLQKHFIFNPYYLENGKWYDFGNHKCENFYALLEEVNKELPNYVSNITYIKKVIWNDEECDLYLFESKPYGYLDKNLNFIYNYEVQKSIL